MYEKKCDAVEWAYDRYIKGKPDREKAFEETQRQGDIAQQIYDIRNRLGMTREELAEFAGLSPEVIEDVEEADYDGDWDQVVLVINEAFHNWVSKVIVPIAEMPSYDYSVKATGV